MALSDSAKAAVLAEVQRVGLAATTKQIQDAYVAAKVGAAQTELDKAVSMAVQDWPALEAFLTAGVSSTALYPVRASIAAKLAARDETGLGILLLTLYAADKAHRG